MSRWDPEDQADREIAFQLDDEAAARERRLVNHGPLVARFHRDTGKTPKDAAAWRRWLDITSGDPEYAEDYP